MHKILSGMLAVFGVCFLLSTSLSTVEASQHATANELNTDCISPLLTKRHSGYLYDNSRPVTHEQLQAIVEAGRSTPSSYNEQPWRFIVCDRNSHPQAYDKALSTLVEFNQGWAKRAPVLIVAVAATKSSHKGTINRWSHYDTGAAAFSMTLQATSLGLMVHQMGGFDEARMRQVFSIPEDFAPLSVLAIGYQDSTEAQAERKRKPIAENFFIENWAKGFE